jgi:hypothetical protein
LPKQQNAVGVRTSLTAQLSQGKMLPAISDWTVVIPGSWNVAILNPNWVATELFQTAEVQVEIRILGPEFEFRYRHEQVTIVPRTSRVMFVMADDSATTLASVESTASRLLQLLPRTPVSAIGVNFGFTENEVPSALAEMFSLLDDNALGDRQLEILETSISRKIPWRGERTLKFRRTLKEGAVSFHLNFHKDVPGADEARAALGGEVETFRNEAIEFLHMVYAVELENQEGVVANGQ